MPNGIIHEVKRTLLPGTNIPKPSSKGTYKVKGWGTRRGEEALIYMVPNLNDPSAPYEKGVTISELRLAYEQLQQKGEFSRKWFDSNLKGCAAEGGCNFTTMGGIFEVLGKARYARGKYIVKSGN